jgi:lipoate-protein ligase A
VLGAAQRSVLAQIESRARDEILLLERSSGGGAVLTGPWMVSASAVLPAGHRLLSSSLIDDYRWWGEVHADALADCGVPARVISPRELPDDHSSVKWACFGGLSPWEVIASDGRKLTGLAQRRHRGAALFVAGTLTAACDWSLLCDVMGHFEDESALRRCTVCCADLLGRPLAQELFAARLKFRIAAAVRGNPMS